jgi:hypothetical protein
MTEVPTINRYAIIVLPTDACLEWVKSCPDYVSDSPLGEMEREPTVYLIPDARLGPDNYIRRHYKPMFQEELNSWHTDPSMWPKDLTFKTFKKFFTILVTTMVYDLGKGQIKKEDED